MPRSLLVPGSGFVLGDVFLRIRPRDGSGSCSAANGARFCFGAFSSGNVPAFRRRGRVLSGVGSMLRSGGRDMTAPGPVRARREDGAVSMYRSSRRSCVYYPGPARDGGEDRSCVVRFTCPGGRCSLCFVRTRFVVLAFGPTRVSAMPRRYRRGRLRRHGRRRGHSVGRRTAPCPRFDTRQRIEQGTLRRAGGSSEGKLMCRGPAYGGEGAGAQ